MSKYLTVIILFATATWGFPQATRSDSLKTLALNITRGLSGEQKKVDAIFKWVTDNIEYDIEALKTNRKYPAFIIESHDSLEAEKEYNEAVALMVVNRKKGICDGYARLFKSLCNHSGIQCEVVPGRSKDIFDDKLGLHAWNAVKIQNKWHLLDATWASGSFTYGSDTFIKKLNNFYYLTPPEKMFVNHLPNDQKWTLLDKAYDSIKFFNSPIEDIRVVQNGLKDYYPKNKTINYQKGQLITVWLEFEEPPTKFNIEVSERGTVTRASLLNIELTDKVYDSLYNIDPNFFRPIEQIQIVSKKIIENRIEFTIKPLSEIKGLHVHVDYGFPALIYDIVYIKK